MQSSSSQDEAQKVSINITNQLRCLCISKNIIQEYESSRQNNQKRSNQTKLQQYQTNRCMFFASENERNNCSQEGKEINSSTNEGNLHAATDNLIKRSISMKTTYDNSSQQHHLKKSQKQLDKSKDHLEIHNDGSMPLQDNALTYKKPSEHMWQSYFFSDSVNPNENQLKNQRSSQDNLPKRRSSMLKNLAHNGSSIHSVTCSPSLSPSKGIQNLKSKRFGQSQVLVKSAYLSKNNRSQSTKGNKNFSKEKRNTAHSCLDFLKELNELKVIPVKQNHIVQINQQDLRQLTSQQKQQQQQESEKMKVKETNLRIGVPRLVVNETNKSKSSCSKLRTQKEWRTLISEMAKKQKPSLPRENPENNSIFMKDLLKTQKTSMKNIPQEKNLRLTPKKNILFSKYLESTSLHIQETRDISESGSQHSITPSQQNQGSESGSSTQRNYNTTVLNISKLSDMIVQQKQMEQLLTPRGKQQTESEKKRNCQSAQSKNEVRANSEEKVLEDKSSRCSRRKGEEEQVLEGCMPKYFNSKSQEQQPFPPAKEIKETLEENKIKRRFFISTPIGQKSEGRIGQKGKSIFTENNEQDKQLRSQKGDYYYSQHLHSRNPPERARLTLFSNWFAERDKTTKSCHNNTTSDNDQGQLNNCEFFPENDGSETSNNNNLSNAKISSMTSEESACCRATLTSTADLSCLERVHTEPTKKDKKKVVVVVNSSVMQQVSTPRITDVGRNQDKKNTNNKNNSVHSERVSFNLNVKSSPQILLNQSHTARHFESHGSVYSQHSSNSKNVENNLNQSNSDFSDGLQTWGLCQDYWVMDKKEFKSNASVGYANARQELLLVKKSDWSLWEAIEKPRRQKVQKIKNIQQKDTKSQSLMETGRELEHQCIIEDNLIGLTTMEINSFEAFQAEIRVSQVNNKCKKVLAGQLYQNSKTVGVVREWGCYGNLSEMLSVSGLLNEKIISVIFKNFLQILIETIRETGWMVRLDHCSIHFDANCQVILGLNIGTAMNVDLSFLQYISNIHQSQSCFEIESLQHLEQKSQMVSEEQEVISPVGSEDQQIPNRDSSAPSHQSSEISLKKTSNEHSQMQGSSQESMRNFMANCRKYNTKSDENISATERGFSVSKACHLGEEDLVFELGFIILKSLIGQEYVLFNRNYFFANTLGPAFSKNLKENLLKKSSNCCFFHDLKKTVQSSDVNAFIDLKRAKELCGFLEKNCQESLLKILCGSMKYKKTERITLERMKEMLDDGSETISQQKQTILLRHLFEQLRIKQSLSQRNSENHLKHEKTLMRIAKTLQKSGGEKADLAGKIARQIAIKFYMHTNEVLQVLSEKS